MRPSQAAEPWIRGHTSNTWEICIIPLRPFASKKIGTSVNVWPEASYDEVVMVYSGQSMR